MYQSNRQFNKPKISPEDKKQLNDLAEIIKDFYKNPKLSEVERYSLKSLPQGIQRIHVQDRYVKIEHKVPLDLILRHAAVISFKKETLKEKSKSTKLMEAITILKNKIATLTAKEQIEKSENITKEIEKQSERLEILLKEVNENEKEEKLQKEEDEKKNKFYNHAAIDALRILSGGSIARAILENADQESREEMDMKIAKAQYLHDKVVKLLNPSMETNVDRSNMTTNRFNNDNREYQSFRSSFADRQQTNKYEKPDVYIPPGTRDLAYQRDNFMSSSTTFSFSSCSYKNRNTSFNNGRTPFYSKNDTYKYSNKQQENYKSYSMENKFEMVTDGSITKTSHKSFVSKEIISNKKNNENIGASSFSVLDDEDDTVEKTNVTAVVTVSKTAKPLMGAWATPLDKKIFMKPAAVPVQTEKVIGSKTTKPVGIFDAKHVDDMFDYDNDDYLEKDDDVEITSDTENTNTSHEESSTYNLRSRELDDSNNLQIPDIDEIQMKLMNEVW